MTKTTRQFITSRLHANLGVNVDNGKGGRLSWLLGIRSELDLHLPSFLHSDEVPEMGGNERMEGSLANLLYGHWPIHYPVIGH